VECPRVSGGKGQSAPASRSGIGALPHCLSLGAVLLLALIGYGFLLTPGQVPYSRHSDFVCQGLATKWVLYESLHSGRGVPFWRSDELSGNVALTNPQSLYTFPLNFLFWLWPPLKAVGPTLWLHFVTAGIAGYVLGMALGVGLWPRLLMAAAMMFNFKLIIINYSGWLPVIPGMVTLPLLLAAVFYALRCPGLTATVWLAFAGTLCLHTGHLQLFYYAMLALTVYVLARTVKWIGAREWAVLQRTWATLAAGAALAAAMTAYLLLPLATDAPMLSRGHASFDFFVGGHALRLRHLVSLLYPEALGTCLDGSYETPEFWEDVAYFGIVPLVLALVGMVLAWQRPPARFLMAGFVASLLLALDTPILCLAYEVVPGFRLFRLPARFLFLTSLFGVALAGLASDEIVRRVQRHVGRAWVVPLAAMVLIFIIGGEGAYYARRYLQMAPPEWVLPDNDYQRFFAQQPGPFRIAPLHRFVINYGWAAPMNLQLITGFDPYNYEHYQTYFDLMQHGRPTPARARVWTDHGALTRPDLLDALNVTHLVSHRPVPLPPARFALAAHLERQPVFIMYDGLRQSDMFIYKNRGALPRVFLVTEVRPARDWDAAVGLLQITDVRSAAVVEGAPPEVPAAGTGSVDDEAALTHWESGYLRLRTKTQGPRYLVISEVWHPGWRAAIDGKKLPLFRTNLALLGTFIPGGQHEIVVWFRPVGWRMGMIVTGIGGAVLLGLMAAAWQRRDAKGDIRVRADVPTPVKEPQ